MEFSTMPTPQIQIPFQDAAYLRTSAEEQSPSTGHELNDDLLQSVPFEQLMVDDLKTQFKGAAPNGMMNPNVMANQGSSMIQPMSETQFIGAMPMGDIYGNRMGANGAMQGPGAATGGNHALQDYQMQLMLLEQQNKKRFIMVRQKQDNISGDPTMPGQLGMQEIRERHEESSVLLETEALALSTSPNDQSIVNDGGLIHQAGPLHQQPAMGKDGGSTRANTPKCPAPRTADIPTPSVPPDLLDRLGQQAEAQGIDLYGDNAHSRFYERLLDVIQKLEYEKRDLQEQLKELYEKDEISETESHHEEVDTTRFDPIQTIVIYRVYCVKQPFTGPHHSHPYVAHFLDNPRLFKGDTKYSPVRGNQRIIDVEEYLKRHMNLNFVIYRDYECGIYRKVVKKHFQFTPHSRWILKKDGPPLSNCHFEEIQMRSINMKIAMEKVERSVAGGLVQWWKSCMMPAPYLPLFYYQAQIEEKVEKELTEEQQIPLRLLLDYVKMAYASSYSEAQDLFAQGIVSRQHYSKLFVPQNVVVGSENGHPRAWLCEDWPEKVSPFANAKDKYGWHRRSVIISMVLDPSFQLNCKSWSFDGQFRNDKLTLVCRWPSNDRANIQICDLDIFPLKYDQTGLQGILQHRGQKFWSCRRRTYISYKVPDSQPGAPTVGTAHSKSDHQ
jgi:hypothetical protein